MIKILICDDEAIIRQGIRKILENFYGDIEVRECGDGMEIGRASCRERV